MKRVRPAISVVVLSLAVVIIGPDVEAANVRGRADRDTGSLHVSGGGPLSTIAEAARVARDGDVVEIEAGDYIADVAVWTQRTLTIRGVNGRARVIASGASVEGKAIWVIRGQDVVVENVEFIGARVADRNGAGIRFEGDRLVVRNCRFEDNENGILGGKAGSELEIHNSEFVNNGAGDGYSHNLYAGGRRLLVRGSYFARSRVGHLLKSRAQESLILYNRLSGEDGTSSYELEFPDGGTAIVIGNLIEQGPASENPKVMAFGTEGYKFTSNHLYLSHNTLVNRLPAEGTFVYVASGEASITAVNNVTVGPGTWQVPIPGTLIGNAFAARSQFADPDAYDYRLRRDSKVAGSAVSLDNVRAPFSLRPTEEYVHPAQTRRLGRSAKVSPGAFQTLAP